MTDLDLEKAAKLADAVWYHAKENYCNPPERDNPQGTYQRLQGASSAISQLLAEVKRLRTENEQLSQKVAASTAA